MSSSEFQRPPIRLALLGLGRSIFQCHYPIFKAHPSLFTVVCACDLVKSRRDRVAKDYPNCRMYRQATAMFEERDIDLVVIATPTVEHVKHTLAALDSGHRVLLETPLALTYDDAMILRGAAMKAKGKLMMLHQAMMEPDFILAKQMMDDYRLGPVHQIVMRRHDYVRRDDWQCVKRLGGGAAYYAMPDMMMQCLKLLPQPPVQMWSELKRLVSLGDSEDYVHVCLKTRDAITADVEYSGGVIPGDEQPAFVLRSTTGFFTIPTGATEGVLTRVDPEFKFPRRRSSVRTPAIVDLHEQFPVITERITLAAGTGYGITEFWKRVYNTIRIASPFPVSLEDAITVVKFAQLMKKTSIFGK